MVNKLTVGMKSWTKQDYQNISESPTEYDITDGEKAISILNKRN